MEVSKKRLPYMVVVAIALIGLALAGYFYYELNKARQNPQVQAQKEAKELVAKVSRLVVVPEGEIPTIATVSDPEALKEQAFFAGAQKGDKVLIFAQAKKAILYSPTLDKIIEVAPLNIGNTSTKSSTQTTEENKQ